MVLTLETSHTFPYVACPSSAGLLTSEHTTHASASLEKNKIKDSCSEVYELTWDRVNRIPFPYIVLAHNQRYPSPYGRHILSSDVISRSFHPDTNVLRTTRLVLKRGKVPRWAPRVIQKIDTTWVLEESEIEMGLVEPDGITPVREAAPSSSQEAAAAEAGPASVPPSGIKRELRTRSRNIDRTEFMEVFEWQVFRPLPEDTLA